MTEATGYPTRSVCRDAVTVADSAHPQDTAPTDAVTPPRSAKGARTHVWVAVDGSGANAAVLVTLYGYNAAAAQWYSLGQLNSGSTITPTTDSALTPNNNDIFYAESVEGVSAYDRLWAAVTSFTQVTSVTVSFGFESA